MSTPQIYKYLQGCGSKFLGEIRKFINEMRNIVSKNCVCRVKTIYKCVELEARKAFAVYKRVYLRKSIENHL